MDSNEIPKYRKKSHKSSKKSDHKHEYQECLLRTKCSLPKEYYYYHATYCVKCGKILNWSMFECKEKVGNCVVMMSNEELHQKYKHLITFGVNSEWDKYVVLGGEVK